MSFTFQGGRVDRLPAAGPAAGDHSVLHIQNHGRLLARHAVGRLGGSYLIHKERIEEYRLLLWLTFLSFPLPFIATLTGWFTAEVGRQPWTVYGVLRTADAMTPFLTARTALTSLVVFCVVYSFIFAFGTYYIHRLLRAGPEGRLVLPPAAAIPNRPMSVVDEHRLTPAARHVAAGE